MAANFQWNHLSGVLVVEIKQPWKCTGVGFLRWIGSYGGMVGEDAAEGSLSHFYTVPRASLRRVGMRISHTQLVGAPIRVVKIINL
jgi:hypothetical protein